MEEKLLTLLKKEEEKLSNFVELLKEKRDAMEKNETARLEEILENEERAVRELDSLEKERFSVTNEIAKFKKCKAILSEILTHTKEPMRHQLSLAAARLTELLNEVSLINLGVQQMIAYRLEEFELFMDTMRGKKVTYDGYENDRGGTIFNGRA